MRIMGILNLTPDSFSDGGLYTNPHLALKHAKHCMQAGASIVDVGAESSRPGAVPVSEVEELDRLRPVLKLLKSEGIPFSVDSYKAEVQAEAIRLGAVMINDIFGGSKVLYELAEKSRIALCLMHTPAPPETMMEHAIYKNVLTEVCEFFADLAKEYRKYDLSEVLVDPGIGFGKNLKQNLALLQNLDSLKPYGDGILLGVSRKSLIRDILKDKDLGPTQRLPGSIALALHARQEGVKVLRVHDVSETIQALRVSSALKSEKISRLRLQLKDLKVQARIGVNAEEKLAPQTLAVNLILEGNLEQVAEDDRLGAIDYVSVCEAVRTFAVRDHIQTLEAFVDKLALELGSQFALSKLKVEACKPRYCNDLELGSISVAGDFVF